MRSPWSGLMPPGPWAASAAAPPWSGAVLSNPRPRSSRRSTPPSRVAEHGRLRFRHASLHVADRRLPDHVGPGLEQRLAAAQAPLPKGRTADARRIRLAPGAADRKPSGLGRGRAGPFGDGLQRACLLASVSPGASMVVPDEAPAAERAGIASDLDPAGVRFRPPSRIAVERGRRTHGRVA